MGFVRSPADLKLPNWLVQVFGRGAELYGPETPATLNRAVALLASVPRKVIRYYTTLAPHIYH
jgi:hypothetical protein